MMWKSNLSLSNLICRKWRAKHYKALQTECLEVHHNYLHVQIHRLGLGIQLIIVIIILCPYTGSFIQASPGLCKQSSANAGVPMSILLLVRMEK